MASITRARMSFSSEPIAAIGYRSRLQMMRLGPQAVAALFRDALKQALAFAAKGAACYAIVASGILLPHFVAAFDDSGFSFKHPLVWVKQQFVIGMADYQPRHAPVLYGWLENGAHHHSRS
jgi:hypothetical protein